MASTVWAKQKMCGDYARIEYVYPFGVGNPFYRVSQKFIESIHQDTSCEPLVISKPGANGLIASNYVRDKSIDTYRVLIASTSTATLNGLIRKEKDGSELEPLGLLFRHAQVMICRGEIKSLDEFLKIASKREMKMSTTGVGGVFDLLGRAYAQEFGFKVMDVPYQNNHLLPLLQGEVDFTFVNTGQALEYSNNGIVTPLLRTGGKSLAVMPKIKSISDFFPYLDFEVTWGLMTGDSDNSNTMKKHIWATLSNEKFFKKQELEIMAKNYGLILPRTGSLGVYQQNLSREKKLFTEIIRKINFKVI